MDDNPAQITSKEILMELIREEREKYPKSMDYKHVMEILDTSNNTVYDKLKKGEIPGGRNIPGIGWRINRDVFFAWYYTAEV